MNISKKSIVLTAAFSGLLAGTMSRVNAGVSSGSSNPTLTSAPAFAGHAEGSTVAANTEKHACQGKNSCKGKGGCNAGDNGCKGKNTCKGKGGCATDGSKKG